MPDTVDIASLDFCDDPRAWGAADDQILLPSLRSRALNRVAFQSDDGYWSIEGAVSAEADIVDAGTTDLRAFASMEEALYHVLGEPIELLDPEDLGDSYNLCVEGGDDPIWVAFTRDTQEVDSSWTAHISQPPLDGYPARFCGATPLDALMQMYGIRVADDEDGNYEYTQDS